MEEIAKFEVYFPTKNSIKHDDDGGKLTLLFSESALGEVMKLIEAKSAYQTFQVSFAPLVVKEED